MGIKDYYAIENIDAKTYEVLSSVRQEIIMIAKKRAQIFDIDINFKYSPKNKYIALFIKRGENEVHIGSQSQTNSGLEVDILEKLRISLEQAVQGRLGLDIPGFI